MNYTQQYQTLGHSEKIVTVTAPSGFAFQFKAPKVHFLITRIGRFQQTLTLATTLKDAEAVKNADPIDVEEGNKLTVEIIDYMLERSHLPKLVRGDAESDSELSVDSLSSIDFDFLFNWTAAGGSGDKVTSFPDGQGSNLASRSRGKKRSGAAK